MPKCLLVAVFDPIFSMLCVTAKKWIALWGQNLIKACINGKWMVEGCWGMEWKQSAPECEQRCAFQLCEAVVELSEVWEVLSVALINLDVRYRLAEWKRLWCTVRNKPWSVSSLPISGQFLCFLVHYRHQLISGIAWLGCTAHRHYHSL